MVLLLGHNVPFEKTITRGCGKGMTREIKVMDLDAASDFFKDWFKNSGLKKGELSEVAGDVLDNGVKIAKVDHRGKVQPV